MAPPWSSKNCNLPSFEDNSPTHPPPLPPPSPPIFRALSSYRLRRLKRHWIASAERRRCFQSAGSRGQSAGGSAAGCGCCGGRKKIISAETLNPRDGAWTQLIHQVACGGSTASMNSLQRAADDTLSGRAWRNALTPLAVADTGVMIAPTSASLYRSIFVKSYADARVSCNVFLFFNKQQA